ncbi:trypsin-like serine peptidase [Histidinibacterium lentulum]|uniref:S1 family peptidase n=1 Tax=Histidinibacterium lentulum TaxID=2480588 RepID=A0A3N2QR94_9RHOB|nr:trypsin-like serine protease [Histidinibacterium lentulum]ROT97727.1 S1 family peptidase [Histidinibacterium lentulum]
MRRILSAFALLWAALPALAQDTDLRALETLDAARGWEAVGRLDIAGKGFCTAALIDETTLLTAAHCLYDRQTGERIDPSRMEFRAGFRDGRALAYRDIRRAVAHPGYVFGASADMANLGRDVALLELSQPIRHTGILPFPVGLSPREGDPVGIVSYAEERSERPSLQESCDVLGRQDGIYVMSCDVNFGSSGAPVFSLSGGVAQIVSLVSAKAELEDGRVALGVDLEAPLAAIRAEMAAGRGTVSGVGASTFRTVRPGETSTAEGGPKFIRP